MAKVCAICSKGTLAGRNIRHKASGSWAMKAPRTVKKSSPNLRPLRVESVVGAPVTLTVCMKCYKRATGI